MTNIVRNKNLDRKIVWAIDKAVTDDISQFRRDNRLETYNALPHLRGDYIITNLQNQVVGEDVELIRFKRCAWVGYILVDRQKKITYTITTQGNLHAIPRKKNRDKPHFLQSILAIENGNCKAKAEQLTLFPREPFEARTLQNDYNTIVAGTLNPSEGYRHYVIAYKIEKGELQDVKLKFLDKNFNIVGTASLNEYIKPDFARLTGAESSEGNTSDKPIEGARGLVKLKAGIRPKLREVEKEA